ENPSQSSSHPISPISKTVFDEDEPCVNPKKVKFLGNIDQLLKERPPNYKEDIEAALMEDEIEDFTQADTEHAVPPKAVKFRDERCILYLTEDIPTEDDVLENNGNSV
uniref:Reverse transcriptase domain-containing protein n=1 Tax=Ascaris lumbricoides TaxID=6252 RepID=A0A0M3INC2_ASCLU